MKNWGFALAAVLSSVNCPTTWATDLNKIDRSIRKEPAYQTKTQHYCLLVFGPEAKTRVWLVLDGDVLYVDRNGNSDLTEEGERIRVSETTAEKQGPIAVRHRFEAGSIVESAGKQMHTQPRGAPIRTKLLLTKRC
jgi:hypothetical protein